MAREIVVTTGARLHFGFLSCKPTSGPQFGGAGLMIDSPGFEIAVRESDRFSVIADPLLKSRIEKYSRSFIENDVTPSLSIEVRSEIPSHAGLGSGTQLALAVAAGITKLRGGDVDARLLATRTMRGARSAIGIHGFQHGGFLVDAGKRGDNEIGTLAARADFPTAWRMMLVAPKTEAGLSGSHELDAFARLAPMPSAQTSRLSDIALSEMLPAVIAASFDNCGDAIYEFGAIVGNYFAPVQAGTYASPSMCELVNHLRSAGVRGVGQTSWGPTIFALCRDEGEAAGLSSDLQRSARWHDCNFHIAAPKNTGAEIRVVET